MAELGSLTAPGVTADYVLAIIDPESGKRLVDSVKWKAAIAGAAVIDLVRWEALRLTEPGEQVKAGRLVRAAEVKLPGQAWSDVLERSDGQTPKNAVARIGGASTMKDRAGRLWDDVVEQLEAENVLRSSRHTVLGVIPSTRWELPDPLVRERLVRRLRSALQEGARVDDASGALICVLFASDSLAKVLPAEDRRWLKQRGKAVSESDWGSAAIRKAIQDVHSAMATVATMSAVAAATS